MGIFNELLELQVSLGFTDRTGRVSVSHDNMDTSSDVSSSLRILLSVSRALLPRRLWVLLGNLGKVLFEVELGVVRVRYY